MAALTRSNEKITQSQTRLNRWIKDPPFGKLPLDSRGIGNKIGHFILVPRKVNCKFIKSILVKVFISYIYCDNQSNPFKSTSPTKRGNQLPNYGGHIGGKNLQSMDDVIEKFEPFTCLRTVKPREAEPN